MNFVLFIIREGYGIVGTFQCLPVLFQCLCSVKRPLCFLKGIKFHGGMYPS